MQSILTSDHVVYFPFLEQCTCLASILYGTAPLSESSLSLFCCFDQPQTFLLSLVPFITDRHVTQSKSDPVSPNTHPNDPKFGCAVFFSGMTSIRDQYCRPCLMHRMLSEQAGCVILLVLILFLNYITHHITISLEVDVCREDINGT